MVIYICHKCQAVEKKEPQHIGDRLYDDESWTCLFCSLKEIRKLLNSVRTIDEAKNIDNNLQYLIQERIPRRHE
jgi:hypothetical protein